MKIVYDKKLPVFINAYMFVFDKKKKRMRICL